MGKAKCLFHIPVGTNMISAIIKDLKAVRLVIPNTSPINSPIWPMQKDRFLGEWQ